MWPQLRRLLGPHARREWERRLPGELDGLPSDHLRVLLDGLPVSFVAGHRAVNLGTSPGIAVPHANAPAPPARTAGAPGWDAGEEVRRAQTREAGRARCGGGGRAGRKRKGTAAAAA